MFVMFVSASTKAARGPVAQVLDLYAQRVGPDCWTTLITEKGLETVRMHLSENGTRGMSVLCRKISGFSRRHAPVQWVIGNKHRFLPEDGSFSIMSKMPLVKSSTSAAFSAITLLRDWARIAGACHDLGKNNVAFQEKIRKNLCIADSVRHEILSTFLMTAQPENNLSAADRWFRQPDHQQLSVSITSARCYVFRYLSRRTAFYPTVIRRDLENVFL